jgi:TRAP-type C4-dicarboxylate transport system permease small subunit
MKILKWLDDKLEESILVLFLVVISVVMMLQVFMRAFGNSLSWPEEFCRYVYVWTVFFSLGYTVRKGNMLRVGVVMDLVPQTARKVIAILVNLGCFLVFTAFFVNSLNVVNAIVNSGQKSTAMGMPMHIVYRCTEIGFLLGGLRTVQAIFLQIRNFNKVEQTTIDAIKEEAKAEAAMAAEDLKTSANGKGAQ